MMQVTQLTQTNESSEHVPHASVHSFLLWPLCYHNFKLASTSTFGVAGGCGRVRAFAMRRARKNYNSAEIVNSGASNGRF